MRLIKQCLQSTGMMIIIIFKICVIVHEGVIKKRSVNYEHRTHVVLPGMIEI